MTRKSAAARGKGRKARTWTAWVCTKSLANEPEYRTVMWSWQTARKHGKRGGDHEVIKVRIVEVLE